MQELLETYEHSVKLAQDEVKATIEKLRTNGTYYESMINL